MKTEELLNQLGEKEKILVNKKEKWVVIFTTEDLDPEYPRIKRIFRLQTGGELEELDFNKIKRDITKKIMAKIDAKKLLEMIIKENITIERPKSVFEIMERLAASPEVSITPRTGCVEISIGGKVGKPFPLRVA